MPHQRQALREIIPAARKHPRFTTIMPCGTGKTMVQLWTAEALKPMTVLVLLPSLSLLRQTLHEWMSETKWKNFEVLCVCSDQTVGQHREDEVQISPEEIGYPVTSDSAEIAAFLSKKVSGVKLIFSTYHSSPLVAVGMGKNFWLDLGIFDEAHVTAGEEDGLFSFALEDKNLRIRKRSFWTATPRHYDLSRHTSEENLPVVYSMDDKDIYGPVAHKLTFRKAVEQCIICDYEVLVTVVSNTMLGVGSIDDGDVLVKGTRVPARIVAHHFALNKAIEGFGVTKIFSFHPRVHDAEEFTNGGPQSVVHHLPKDFQIFHVNGDMTTALREEKIGAFRRSGRALMSNARCLTQGIDVPAVDLVAFFSKKRSLIDIVQATGRAMRRAPGKTKGYILIPLYVQQEEGETLEQAVERSDFREVWAVLNAMREQDEALADTLSRIRIKGGEDDGPNVNPPPDGTIIIDTTVIDVPITIIGPRVNIENLRRAITTICVNKLTSNWDEMYGYLLAFKRRYGHCDVPLNWTKNKKLGTWVSHQRTSHMRGVLGARRMQRLNSIGFSWDVLDTNWEKRYQELKEYKERFGDCNVPDGWPENPKLGDWLTKQKVRYTQGKLELNRKNLLEMLGVTWDKRAANWEKRYQELKEYKERFGDCNVPRMLQENKTLASWVARQRMNFHEATILPDRQRRLEELGFVWTVRRW